MLCGAEAGAIGGDWRLPARVAGVSGGRALAATGVGGGAIDCGYCVITTCVCGSAAGNTGVIGVPPYLRALGVAISGGNGVMGCADVGLFATGCCCACAGGEYCAS